MRKSQRIRKITEAQKEINKPTLYVGKFRQSKRDSIKQINTHRWHSGMQRQSVLRKAATFASSEETKGALVSSVGMVK